MIRHSGKTARAEENRIVMANRRQSVLRHHAAVPRSIFAAPGEFIPFECHSEFAPGCFESAHTLGHDLFTDSVTGNHSYTVRLHYGNPYRGKSFRLKLYGAD